MPVPDKDMPARPADKPDAEDEALIYRVPDQGPAHGSVTIDHRDGSFTYRPSLGEEDADRR